MDKKFLLNNKYTVKVVSSENQQTAITADDAEMDVRVKQAVNAAITKAMVCKKPVARYDVKSGKAYIEYTDGSVKYVK